MSSLRAARATASSPSWWKSRTTGRGQYPAHSMSGPTRPQCHMPNITDNVESVCTFVELPGFGAIVDSVSGHHQYWEYWCSNLAAVLGSPDVVKSSFPQPVTTNLLHRLPSRYPQANGLTRHSSGTVTIFPATLASAREVPSECGQLIPRSKELFLEATRVRPRDRVRRKTGRCLQRVGIVTGTSRRVSSH